MKVYIDLIILINSLYDFLILSSVSILLKRRVNIKRIMLGMLIGSMSLITLFIKMSNLMLLLLKIIISVLMVIITFGKRNFKDNIFYFYIITIILGGTSYLINDNIINKNIILLLIISPIILFLYIKDIKDYKKLLNKIYDVLIIDGNNTYKLNGFIDTGNNLKDVITNLPVILINHKYKIKSSKEFYVPYKVLNNEGILKCFKVDKVIVNSKEVNVLIGVANNNIFNSKYDVILNELIRENI